MQSNSPATRADIAKGRKIQMERYRRYVANARQCRRMAENAHTVAGAMRLVHQADEWAARAYHEVA